MKGKRGVPDLNEMDEKLHPADQLKHVVVLELDAPADEDGQETAVTPGARAAENAQDSFEEHAGRMEAFRRSHAGFR
jgi:hypothetical protein